MAQSQAASQPPADLSSELNRMGHRGEWDAIISRVTEALTASSPPSDRGAQLYRYYRGDAYRRIGLLDEAASDFQSIVDNGSPRDLTYTYAEAALKIVQRQIAVRPPIRRDIMIDGQIRFSLFADSDDIAFQELSELAPVAANAVRSLTGETPRRTVILLFESQERLQAFNDIPRPSAPWNKGYLAVGGVSGVEIGLLRKGGTFVCEPRSPYYRCAIAHEYMHVNVQRILGAQAGLPVWLNEGIANMAGVHCASSEQAHFVREFKMMIANHQVETLEQMSGRGFYEAAFSEDAATKASFSYAQALSMTAFLLLGRRETIFGDLLKAVRQTNDFETAFQQTFGESVKDFYAEWQEYALPKKAANR